MNPIVEKVYQIGIIPVIAFNSVDEALPLCKALSEGGLPAAEVTFRTACAEECIRKIHEEMPEMLLGAGTVLTTEQADRAMAAGARQGEPRDDEDIRRLGIDHLLKQFFELHERTPYRYQLAAEPAHRASDSA